MFLPVILAVACLGSKALSHSLISPCKVSDMACIENSVKAAIPKILSGDPELGVESSDPLFIDKIEGNLSILKYHFYNTTQTGFKNCAVSNLRVDEGLTKLHYDLTCPKITMTGKYDISGRLIILPVEGSGDYSLVTGKYVANIDSELKKVQGEDGKTHLNIKNFKLKCTALEPVKYDFKNLFNGQKDLSDAVHKFAHESWKEVAELVQDPTWYGCIKKMTSNVNKYLKHIALEDIMIQ